jgi:hypothetical protein
MATTSSNISLKPYARFNTNGNIVPGTLNLYRNAPTTGIWKEMQPIEYFNKTTKHYRDVINTTYPNALLANSVAYSLVSFLDTLGADAYNTVLNSTVCSDDVNASEFSNIFNIGQNPPALNNYLGPFMGGGLAGYPHTGILGAQAWQSHTTSDDNTNGPLLLINMPHIGITQQVDLVAANDNVGRMLRRGKSSATSDNTCGAVATAIADAIALAGVAPVATNAPFVNNYQRYQLALITYASYAYYNAHTYSQNMIQATELIRVAGFTILKNTLIPALTGQKNLYFLSGTFVNVDDGYSACINFDALWLRDLTTWTDLTTAFKATL